MVTLTSSIMAKGFTTKVPLMLCILFSTKIRCLTVSFKEEIVLIDVLYQLSQGVKKSVNEVLSHYRWFILLREQWSHVKYFTLKFSHGKNGRQIQPKCSGSGAHNQNRFYILWHDYEGSLDVVKGILKVFYLDVLDPNSTLWFVI